MLALLESPLVGLLYTLLALLVLAAARVWLQARARGGLARQVSGSLWALMGLRLLQLPVYGLASLGEPLAREAAAALERGVLLLSLALISWLWAPPGGRRRLFRLELLGALGLAAVMLLAAPVGAPFNYSALDYAWGAAGGLAALIRLAQMAAAKPRSAPGLAHLGILLAGQVVHLLLAEPGASQPLAAQAAALLSLPLLFFLPSQEPEPAAVAEETVQEDSPAEEELVIENVETAEVEATEDSEVDPRFLLEEEVMQEEALPSGPAAFFDEPDFDELIPAVQLSGAEELARGLAEKLGADVCVLATLNEAQLQLELQYGYNLMRTAPVEPARISLREVPRLASALLRSRTLRLNAEPGLGDLAAFSQTLRLSFPAHLLAVPFEFPQDLRRWAALALHMERPWSAADEVALEQEAAGLGDRLGELLGVNGRSTAATQLVAPVADELEQTRAELETLQAENERYRADVERLLAHIDALQPQGSEAAAQLATPEPAGEVMAALQQENQRLKASLAALEASPPAAAANVTAEQIKEELRLALEEVAALHAKLEAAQQVMLDAAEQQPGAKIPAEQVELVASIAQELRQPLSSVMGYTDLLLGETVGLLGALQRKFLERVRSSTERMNTLIDNLIRIAELDQNGDSVKRSPVDLGGVIDDALALLREPLQEKRIALRVNLPRQMPPLNTDRDALQQILYHLLQNADAATPMGGAITLRAVFERQAQLGEYVLIQVSDSGGGIPEDALPRVFSRLYRASNPVIPGVGDSGVGLTIAETLTQALGGRIWVDSQPGVGATFSVLLPLEHRGAETTV